MAHLDTKARMVGEAMWTVKRWPLAMDNPGRFRWAVYRDGVFQGGARTLLRAWEMVDSRWWE